MLYQQKDTSKSIKEKDNESDGDDSDEHYSADPSEADDRERDANDAAEKEVTAKDKGKIIKDEQDEIVQVQMKSFARYFNYAGGWCLLIPYGVFTSIPVAPSGRTIFKVSLSTTKSSKT